MSEETPKPSKETIKVTGKNMAKLVAAISHEDLTWLKSQLVGQSICPEFYLFTDSERARTLLEKFVDTDRG